MKLDTILDQLIADHETRSLPKFTARQTALALLPGKADVIVGMRRSGKTYRLYQTLSELEASGVPHRQTFFINFEDERLLPFGLQELWRIPEALYRRYPDVRKQVHWFLFDEIQNIVGWEQFVRRLLDTEKARFVLTGSSAKLLSREIATSLRGRSLTTELMPFSFAEALTHSGIQIPNRWPPPSEQRSLFAHYFQRYMQTGGFPEVQAVAEESRIRILQEYVDVVLFRDVVERHQLSNTVALRHLVRRLIRCAGSLFSIHRLYGELASQGIKVSKDLLHEYLAYLEDAYLLFTVSIDAHSEKKRLVNPRKCYLVDHGLAAAESFFGWDDIGHFLENIVYLQLRRRGGNISYYMTKSGREIDFLVRRPKEKTALIQVCANLSDKETRKRELDALVESFRETDANYAEIVTLDEEETLSLSRHQVRIVPAWRWLLEE